MSSAPTPLWIRPFYGRYGCLPRIAFLPLIALFTAWLFIDPVTTLGGLVWRVLLFNAIFAGVLVLLMWRQTKRDAKRTPADLVPLNAAAQPREQIISPVDGTMLVLDNTGRTLAFARPGQPLLEINLSELNQVRVVAESSAESAACDGITEVKIGNAKAILPKPWQPKKPVRYIALRIETARKEVPVFDVVLYEAPPGSETDPDAARPASVLGEHWKAMLSAAKAKCA